MKGSNSPCLFASERRLFLIEPMQRISHPDSPGLPEASTGQATGRASRGLGDGLERRFTLSRVDPGIEKPLAIWFWMSDSLGYLVYRYMELWQAH